MRMGLLIAKCHEQTLRAGGLFRRCEQDTPNLAPGAETRERARPFFSVPLASRRPPQLPEVVWAAVARHMLYGPGLLAAGWNNSDASPTPNSRIEGNAAAARKAMDALTTRCCGC